MTFGTSVVKVGDVFYLCGVDRDRQRYEMSPFTFDYDTSAIVWRSNESIVAPMETYTEDVVQCTVDAFGTILFYSEFSGTTFRYSVSEHERYDFPAFPRESDVALHPSGDRVARVSADRIYSMIFSDQSVSVIGQLTLRS